MKKKVHLGKKRLSLSHETLRRLDQGDLWPVLGAQSMVSVCYENTKPECGNVSLVELCGSN
jgi:hypothetical protein